MASRVFLHVGTFKSATTYLQAVCNACTDELAAQGVLWLGSSANFAAVKDFDTAAAEGRDPLVWNDLVARSGAHDGDVLVSNELLSLRTRRRTRALVRDFDRTPVQVVLTAREPGRVLTSQWQERARRGPTDSWAAFMERLMADDEHTDPDAKWFWRRQHLPTLVEKFAGVVGIDNVTVVTVPPSQSQPGLLVSRFFSVLGVDLPAPHVVGAQNASMGAYSIEFLRRVHERLTDEQRQEFRIPIKYVLGRGVLTSRRTDEPPIGMTEKQYGWVRDYASEIVGRLRDLDVTVVGELDDLRPGPYGAYRGADPAVTADAHLVEAALDTVVGLVETIDRQARASEGMRYGEIMRSLAVGRDAEED